MNLPVTISAHGATVKMSEHSDSDPTSERWQDNATQAAFWIELRECWEQWKSGIDTPLSPAAAAYFGDLTHRYFCDQLSTYRPGEPLPQRPQSLAAGQVWRAWEMVREYFMLLRPRARTFLFDDIYMRAFRRAGETFGCDPEDLSLEQVIGFLLKQFRMRIRDAVRFHFPPGKEVTGYEDDIEPGGAHPGHALDPNDIADFRSVVAKIVDEYEQETSPRAKVGVFLAHHKISLALAEVRLCLGAKKSALFDEVKKTRDTLGAKVAAVFEADDLGEVEIEVGKLIADDELYQRCRQFFVARQSLVAEGRCGSLVSLVNEKVPTLTRTPGRADRG